MALIGHKGFVANNWELGSWLGGAGYIDNNNTELIRAILRWHHIFANLLSIRIINNKLIYILVLVPSYLEFDVLILVLLVT